MAKDRSAEEMERTHRTRHWTNVLKHRWPTALGIAVAALAVFDLQGGTELAALTMLMPVVYLGSAALDRRWSAWVGLFSGGAGFGRFLFPSGGGAFLCFFFSPLPLFFFSVVVSPPLYNA